MRTFINSVLVASVLLLSKISLFAQPTNVKKEENKFPDGTVETYTYYKNEQKQEVKHGEYKKVSKDGKVREEGNYDEGKRDGTWKFYYPSGDLREVSTYKSNMRDGPYEFYNNKKALQKKGQYVKNRMVGQWTFYYPDGKLKEDKVYKDNKENGEAKEYYENGNVKASGIYKNGLKDSVWYVYEPNGKKQSVTIYSAGALISTVDLSKITFQHTYTSGESTEAEKILITKDNGFVVLCTQGQEGKRDIKVMKFDSTGKIEWEKVHSTPDDEIAHGMCPTADGGFMTVGEVGKPEAKDIIIVKFSAVGNVETAKVYGGPKNDIGFDVRQAPNKDYIICGYTNSSGAGEYDVNIIRLGEDLKVKWNRTHGTPKTEMAFSFELIGGAGSEEFLIIAGESNNTAAGDIDPYVLKINGLLGDTVWTRIYSGVGKKDEHIRQIIQSTDKKGYIIFGSSNSFKAAPNNNIPPYDMWAMRIEEDGNTKLNKSYGGPLEDRGYAIAASLDGYVLVGSTNAKGAKGDNVWFVKVNEKLIRNDAGEKDFGAQGADVGKSVARCRDGGFIVAADSEKTRGTKSLMLIKTDANGGVNPENIK